MRTVDALIMRAQNSAMPLPYARERTPNLAHHRQRLAVGGGAVDAQHSLGVARDACGWRRACARSSKGWAWIRDAAGGVPCVRDAFEPSCACSRLRHQVLQHHGATCTCPRAAPRTWSHAYAAGRCAECAARVRERRKHTRRRLARRRATCPAPLAAHAPSTAQCHPAVRRR